MYHTISSLLDQEAFLELFWCEYVSPLVVTGPAKEQLVSSSNKHILTVYVELEMLAFTRRDESEDRGACQLTGSDGSWSPGRRRRGRQQCRVAAWTGRERLGRSG